MRNFCKKYFRFCANCTKKIRETHCVSCAKIVPEFANKNMRKNSANFAISWKSQKISTTSDPYFLSYPKKTTKGENWPPPPTSRNRFKLHTVITRKLRNSKTKFQNQVLILKSLITMKHSNCAVKTDRFHTKK